MLCGVVECAGAGSGVIAKDMSSKKGKSSAHKGSVQKQASMQRNVSSKGKKINKCLVRLVLFCFLFCVLRLLPLQMLILCAPPKLVDWADIARKLPWGKDKESVRDRQLLFRRFDPNGNGYLSLAEVDKAICQDLQLGGVIKKPVLIRAFNASKSVNQTSHGQHDDFVELREFRILLLYIRQYLELHVMFERIDTSNDGRISSQFFAIFVSACFIFVLLSFGCNQI